MHPDQADIAAANRGDVSGYERLYFRHRDWVHQLACRYTRNSDEALDVLQETFTWFLQKFPGFTLTANLRTFLYPVVKHIALRQKEKTKKLFIPDELPETQAPPIPPNPDAVKSELAQVLKTLKPIQQEIILLRFVDDFTLEEIAQTLKTPLGTVKSHLHRALQTLREHPPRAAIFS